VEGLDKDYLDHKPETSARSVKGKGIKGQKPEFFYAQKPVYIIMEDEL